MNKDIQTLIEREACEHWSHSNYKGAAEKAHSENDICKTSAMARKVSNSSFQAGANFALSLFKWRKVREEDIPVDQIVVLRSGDNYTVIIISDEEIAKYAQGKFKDYEWMPIPQID